MSQTGAGVIFWNAEARLLSQQRHPARGPYILSVCSELDAGHQMTEDSCKRSENGKETEVQVFPLTLALSPLLTGLLFQISRDGQQRKGLLIMLLFGVKWWGFFFSFYWGGGGWVCNLLVLLCMICLSLFTPLQLSKEANSLPSALDSEVFLFVSS